MNQTMTISPRLAFKCTDKDMKCRNTQFELGRTFVHEEELDMCKSGFHFCMYIISIKAYKNFSESRLFIVEYGEHCITDGNKSVTDKITFVEEITIDNVRSLCDAEGFKDIMCKNFNGLLSFSCCKGHPIVLEIVEFLVNKGADIHANKNYVKRSQ